MKHVDNHSVTVAQLKAAVNNLIYFFKNIDVPAHIKNGESFAFSQDVFSDKSLKNKMGVLSGVATLFQEPGKGVVGKLAMNGELTIQNTRVGTVTVELSGSVPIKAHIDVVWGGIGVAYAPISKRKVPFQHSTIVMRMGKNNIVKSVLNGTVAGCA